MNRPQPPFPPLLAVLGLLLAMWFGLAPKASAVCLPQDHSDLFAANSSPGGHQETDALPPKNRVWGNFENPNETTPADQLNSLQLRWKTRLTDQNLTSGIPVFLNADPIGFSGGSNWFAYADGNPISKSDPFGLCAQDGWHNPDGSINRVGFVWEAIKQVPEYIYNNGASSFKRNVTDPQFVLTNALGGMGLGGVTGGLSRVAEEASIVAKGTVSTGRTIAMDLKEQLAMQEVIAKPMGTTPLRLPAMSDTKNGLMAADGWVKRVQNVNGVEIHYVENLKTGGVLDFKFKN